MTLLFFLLCFFPFDPMIIPILYRVNDTHRERLQVFYSVQYKNGWLAASDLFHMFTQSIKFISTDV